MQKVISIVPAIERAFKIVEWKLHNVCNYDCSFCDLPTKSGTQRWMSLDEYKVGIDKVIDACSIENKAVWFRLNGGEPTLFPELPQLLQYIRKRGSYTFLLSNGSRTIRWWKELVDLDCINALHLSYHIEQTDDVQHIIDVANLFKDSSTRVVIYVSCLPQYFDKAYAAHKRILEECDTVVSAMIRITTSAEGPLQYTAEQDELFKQNLFAKSKVFRQEKNHSDIPQHLWYDNHVRVGYNDGKTEIIHPRDLVNKKQIFMSGWNCWAGKELIRIDSKTIYRGVCESGETKDIFKDDVFYDSPIKCPRVICSCPLDLGQEKHKA